MTQPNRTFPHTVAVFLALFVPLLCAASMPAFAQQDEVIKVESNLVQLNVGVVDRQGRAITNLNRGDFVIYEDGVKQNIQTFEPTNHPFSLVLLLDMSGSTITFRETLKQAAIRFLEALGPDDRVAIIAFNEKIKTLSPFSSDRTKWGNAIFAADGRGTTDFYKALQHSLNELEKEGNRRKAIVVMTDGIDTEMRKADRIAAANATTDEAAVAAINPESSATLNAVLQDADRRGITIYPLALPSGDPTRLPLPDPQLIGIYTAARVRMQSLADRTGGRLSVINRLSDLSRMYLQVAADLRTRYTITYQPASKEQKPGWRYIKVETTDPTLVASTKEKYMAR